MPRDHALLHYLQQQCDEVGLRGQQHPQRDWQLQHSLPHQHMRDDVVDQLSGGLRTAPRAAGAKEPAALAAEGQQLVVAALTAA
jgi:hypothetical protein